MVALRWETTKCNLSYKYFSLILIKIPLLKKPVANYSSNISANRKDRIFVLFKRAFNLAYFAIGAHYIVLLSLFYFVLSVYSMEEKYCIKLKFLPIVAAFSVSKICYEHRSEKNISFYNWLLYVFERTLC